MRDAPSGPHAPAASPLPTSVLQDHPPPAEQGRPLLELDKVSKSFAGVDVLRELDLTLEPGSCWGLVGPNGCGKSTLIKVLAGVHRADDGSSISLRGETELAFVHQDLGLVLTATVLENLAYQNGFVMRRGRIDWRRMRETAAALLAEFGADVDVDCPVSDLPPADRALVAIVRAVGKVRANRGAAVLVLDEPTASLSQAEAETVLETMQGVAAQGNAVLFVSHRLNEVVAACDHVAVMSDGALTWSGSTTGLDESDLVEKMLGRAPLNDGRVSRAPRDPDGGSILTMSAVTGERIRELSLSVRAGEIVGVTGLLGSGKSELARIIAGAQRITSGEFSVADRGPVTSPRQAIRRGVGYVPPDRRRDGVALTLSAAENMTLPDLRSFFARGRLCRRRERAETLAQMHTVGAQPADSDRSVATFSGGNQQKIVFAKWLRLNPRLLVLDEPTQAVDVGAISDLHGIIRDRAAAGVGVIICSSEWDDLAVLCDRVLILDQGRLVATLAGTELTADAVTAACLTSSTH